MSPNASKRIIIWLPSPLGDAIMATGALRAFRQLYADDHITFMAAPFTRQILSPTAFCDDWIDLEKGFLANVKSLKAGNFEAAILLKNSFSCALAIRLAGIKQRVGYARDRRSLLLTDKIQPLKDEAGNFKPAPMVDFYLKIATCIGSDSTETKPELSVSDADTEAISEKLPQLKDLKGPLVILVPGGAFGPSKLWPILRYSELADKLAEVYQATVVVSVSPVKEEVDIAEAICHKAASEPINLGMTPLNGGLLKALYQKADLVITNDTGPRHIAIGLDKKLVTLFGPNNPEWTQTGHDKEIQIIGTAPCVPCDKPQCKQAQHLCMESISVEKVFQTAETFLKENAS
ncbi:MAG: lipopolysaccharide heptosyltransferase II [Planctomycetota bacterium]|jgi:heptosyltransferase-2